ncbi:hypothetical protein H5410_000771 [Solanum commersonii]|uniref:Uncharacterized protein n=1 Tax=Solanum commersonii TaxID=4109 RepID=A0A9J6AX02_SOLCO|nr:hypothetical protein H5410_000771 [Solanum commersonii]
MRPPARGKVINRHTMQMTELSPRSVSTRLGDTGDLSTLVDEVIDTIAGDIIENMAGKIMQEDDSQSLNNIQDNENKTEHIKDIGKQEDSVNTTR